MGGTNGSRPDRYGVFVEEYTRFLRGAFLAVRGLVSPAEVAELRTHTDDLMQGRLPEQNVAMAARDVNRDSGVTVQALEAPPPDLSPEAKAQFFLRIHID